MSNVNSAKEQLREMHQELRRLQTQINRSTTVTAIVVVVVLVAMGGWLAYGSRKVDEITDPQTLVDYAAALVRDNLPTQRKELEAQIIAKGPEWAKMLSDSAVEYIPEGRKQLEVFAKDQMDEMVKQAHLMTEKELKAFMVKRRPVLENLFKDLSKDPKLAEKSIEEVSVALGEEMNVDLQNDSTALLKTVKDANKAFKAMRENQKLTQEEKEWRRIAMLARRVWLDNLEPHRLPKTPTVAPTPAPDKKS